MQLAPSSLHTPPHTEEHHHNKAQDQAEEVSNSHPPYYTEHHTHIPDCNSSSAAGQLPEEEARADHLLPSYDNPLDCHNSNFPIHAWDNTENNIPCEEDGEEDDVLSPSRDHIDSPIYTRTPDTLRKTEDDATKHEAASEEDDTLPPSHNDRSTDHRNISGVDTTAVRGDRAAVRR